MNRRVRVTRRRLFRLTAGLRRRRFRHTLQVAAGHVEKYNNDQGEKDRKNDYQCPGAVGRVDPYSWPPSRVVARKEGHQIQMTEA